MKLLPIPGASGYRVDCENQNVYRFCGYLKLIKPRTKYKILTINTAGKTVSTTVYRMMYCAKNKIDITKIPSDVCVCMSNGSLSVRTRSETARDRNTSSKSRHGNIEQWRHNTELINKYYNGDTEPLLNDLQNIEKLVCNWFVNTYGLCRERAEIVSAYGVGCYLDRLADGFPSPFIFGSVLRYARGENMRIRKAKEFKDNMQVIIS